MGRTEHPLGSARLNDALDQRWWSKVNESAGCWEWIGTKTDKGYGQFWNGKREVPAHRYGYEMMRGPVPASLDIDHLCRNPGCVKPTHLEPVTPPENVRRANTHCAKGHPLTPENTYLYPKSGARLCTICNPKYQPTAYRRPRVTPWHATAAQMYEAGATMSEIAEVVQRDDSVVCRALGRMGIEARPAELPIDRTAFEALARTGMSKTALAQVFGCSDQTIRKRAAEWVPDVSFPAGRPTNAQREWEAEMIATYGPSR